MCVTRLLQFCYCFMNLIDIYCALFYDIYIYIYIFMYVSVSLSLYIYIYIYIYVYSVFIRFSGTGGVPGGIKGELGGTGGRGRAGYIGPFKRNIKEYK